MTPPLLATRDASAHNSQAPRRIQRRRTKGWRMPEGAVYVGRPSKWGNDHAVSGFNPYAPDETKAEKHRRAVAWFIDMLSRAPLGANGETVYDDIRRELAGRDLACWCPLDQPCHADVLLEIANDGGARALAAALAEDPS